MDSNKITRDLERATVLLKSGKAQDAETLALQATQSDPSSARAWFLAGVARHQQLRPEGALAAMEHALALEPELAEARQARATLLLGLKRPRAALAEIRELMRRAPGNARLKVEAAIVLEEMEENAAGLELYEEALRLSPRDFRALLNRGALLIKLERLEEALSNNLSLVKSYIGSAAALYNLGDNFLCLHRFEEAQETFSRVLDIEPGHIPARMGRGLALSMLRRFAEASAEFVRARSDNPEEADAYFVRAARSIGHEDVRKLETDPRLIFIHGALLDLASCIWHRREALLEEVARLRRDPAPPEIHDRSLGFNILALPLSQGEQRDVARLVAASVKAPVLVSNTRHRSRARLRIGYLSPDYRRHPAANNHWRQMRLHDREKFEVIGLSLHAGDGGEERKRIFSSCDHFIELSGLDLEAAMARIALEEIDILVDIAGFTEATRPELLAAHVAPIKVQHMGTPGPSGSSHVDYRMTDAIMSPLGEAGQWDEKLVWLPDTCWVCDDTAFIAPAPTRNSCGLPECGFVFCCFNKHYKIEPDIFDVWMRLLLQVEGSVLWLLEDKPSSVANLRREAEARGVAADRLVFAPRLNVSEHLGRHACADLFLDTLYYNAHTTASDALFAGLPVLTLPGRSMASRFCASLVSAAGLPQLVAKDLTEYEVRALHLSRNPEALQAMRRKLLSDRAQSRLFDMPRRTRDIEAAYLEMWRRHESGLPPESFTVTSKGINPA